MKGVALLMVLAANVLSGCALSVDPPRQVAIDDEVLVGTSWQLVAVQSMDDRQGTIRSDDPAKYMIKFEPEGRLSARLDCNRGSGSWRATPADPASGTLMIGALATTKALCPEPSIANLLERNLPFVRGYLLRDRTLSMSLMADGGVMIWRQSDAG